MGLLAGSRRRLLAISAALICFAAAVAVPSAAAAAAPVTPAAASDPASSVVLPAAPIGHAGRWITDATGKVLTVTGLNMVNKLTPYTPAADGFGKAQFLADNGFSSVRVGVIL